MHLSLRSIGRLFSLAVIIGAAVLLVVVLFINDSRPSTNDAYLQADLVRMAPAEVSGRIVALPIRDNQAVKKGDLSRPDAGFGPSTHHRREQGLQFARQLDV